MKEVDFYFDYKSPYSYLANGPAFELKKLGVQVNFIPLVFDLEAVFGSLEKRSKQQWNKVRYLYQDARRFANDRGLIIKGPKKIFDSNLASAAALYMQEVDKFETFNHEVFEKFWCRELDIENEESILKLIEKHGGNKNNFKEKESALRKKLIEIREKAENLGVFGIPSFVFEGELFWGHDRIEFLRRRLK